MIYKRIFIFISAILLSIAVSSASVSANHQCGSGCDEFTQQGACTHGCGENGQTNPDYHGTGYEESTQDWANTYEQIERARVAAEATARAILENKTAEEAKAAADAAAAASELANSLRDASIQAANRKDAKKAAEEAGTLKDYEDKIKAQDAADRATYVTSVVKTVSGQTVDNMCNTAGRTCNDYQDWLDGYNDARKSANFGAVATRPEYTDIVKDLDPLRDGVQVGKITKVGNGFTITDIFDVSGSTGVCINQWTDEVCLKNELTGSGKNNNAVVKAGTMDANGVITYSTSAKNGVEASWKDPANFKAGGACFNQSLTNFPPSDKGMPCGGKGMAEAFCVPPSVLKEDGGSKTCNDYIKENYYFYYVGWVGDGGWDISSQCFDRPGNLWICKGEVVNNGCGPSNSISHSSSKCIPKDKSVCGNTYQLDIEGSFRSIYYTPDWCSGTTTTTIAAPVLTPSVGGVQVQSNPPDTPVAPQCNQACGSGCPSNLTCVSGVCRNPSCTGEASCTCPGSTFQCQQIQILRGGVVITPSQILLNDNITFRGFASATGTTVSAMLFTVTINGVAQAPVSRPATLVGGQYQADYPYTISQATSYSASVVPVSP